MAPKQTIIDIDEDKLKSILEKVAARTPVKPKQGMTLREVITKAKPMITKALKRGYTYDEIAAILTEEGISIKGATLKQYLTESKSKKRQVESSTPTAAQSVTSTISIPAQQNIKEETKEDSKAKVVADNLSDKLVAQSKTTEPKPDAVVDINKDNKTDNKQDTKTKAKPRSVVRGKFTDIPSNDEL